MEAGDQPAGSVIQMGDEDSSDHGGGSVDCEKGPDVQTLNSPDEHLRPSRLGQSTGIPTFLSGFPAKTP